MRTVRVAVLAIMLPASARAQFTVFDPTNYAESVAHYLKALEQIRLAESQIANQVQALKKLGSPVWRQIGGVVQAASVAQSQGAAIAYSSSDLDQRFAARFPAAATRDFPADERARNAATMATLAGALDATRVGASTFAPGATQIDQFKAQVAASNGHEESLELANTVHVYSAEELLLLRQAIAAQTNAQAVYYASQVNAQAQAQENARALLAGMAATPPRRPSFSYRP